MKKTGLIIGVVIAIAAFVMMGGLKSTSKFEKDWGLEIPKGDTEVYSFATEEALYYAVIYEEAADAESAFEWQTEDGETIASGSYSEAINAWMDAAEVPNTLPIDIEAGPYHYMTKEDGSELIIVLDKRMLHFVAHTAE